MNSCLEHLERQFLRAVRIFAGVSRSRVRPDECENRYKREVAGFVNVDTIPSVISALKEKTIQTQASPNNFRWSTRKTTRRKRMKVA